MISLRKEPGKKGELIEKLIKDSIKLMASKGLEKTSFQKIADKSKVTQTVAIYHFKNKLGLLKSIIEYIQNKHHNYYKAQITIEDNAHEKLVKFVSSFTRWPIFYKNEAEVFSLLFYYSAINKEFSRIYQVIAKAWIKTIEEYLLAGKREKLYEFNIDSEQLAKIIFNNIIGIYLNLLAGKKEIISINEINEQVTTIIKNFTGYERRNLE